MERKEDEKFKLSDDEDDIENLRLAALLTLKKTDPTFTPLEGNENIAVTNGLLPNKKFNVNKKFRNSIFAKRRRGGFHNSKILKNGQFRNKIRTSYLIPISVVDSDNSSDKILKTNDDLNTKLTLPQDCYLNFQQVPKEKLTEQTSKFDRYDKSDSESELEELESKDSDSSPKPLKKHDSLEALIQELDNEIMGTGEKVQNNTKKVKKVKKNKSLQKSKNVTEKQEEKTNEITLPKIQEEKTNEITPPKIQEEKTNEITPPKIQEETKQDINEIHVIETINKTPVTFKKKALRKKPPVHSTNFCPSRRSFFPPKFPFPQEPYINTYQTYSPIKPLPTPVVNNYVTPHVPAPMVPFSSAPLSPRSAEFVIQNQKIIEKRKITPKRSYSRSLSPASPFSIRSDRSPSPRNQNRKSSPERMERAKVSSHKSSPPKRDKLSPKREEKREHLNRSRSSSPNKMETLKSFDPILEARKRKFESVDVPIEGVIKLNTTKTTETHEEEKSDNVDSSQVFSDVEDELLIETKIDDIFPEEETDEENEGRFKSSNGLSERSNVNLLPFRKLINGTNDFTITVSKARKKDEHKKRRDHSSSKRHRSSIKQPSSQKRSTKPKEKDRSLTDNEKKNAKKSRSSLFTDKLDSKSVLKHRLESSGKNEKRTCFVFENKKIEIKIRNPSKYEGDGPNYDVLNRDQLKERDYKQKERKVIKLEDESEPEIIIDCEEKDEKNSEDDVLNKKNAGDLRAQLSKKRAERQKIPLKSVQSRLLQNALKGAVYTKEKTLKSKRKGNETAPSGRKLPIHMRLGVPNREKKSKGKRSTNRNDLDQV